MAVELIGNGDFSNGATDWVLGQYGGASVGAVTAGEYKISVTDSGSEWWHVQFRQGGIPLVQGKRYVFSFDAYKGPENNGAQVMEINVGEDGGDYLGYFNGHDKEITLTPDVTHYSFVFEMTAPDDPAARVEFNCGKYTGTFYIDNVSLGEAAADEALLSASATSVDFGTAAVGESETAEIVLSNEGGADTLISGISIGSNVFAVDVSSPFTVAAGDSAVLNVSFNPDALGEVADVLVIESNAVDNPSLSIGLVGTGVATGLKMAPSTLLLEAGVDESARADVLFENTSGEVIDWRVDVDEPWLAVSPEAGSLSAGESTTVTVTADAEGLSGGTYHDDIVVTHTAANIDSPYPLPVTFEVKEGYKPTSPYLNNPSSAIAFVEDVARFRAKARDDVNGGFYTHITRQGNPSSENEKSLCGQSRLGYAFVRAFMLTGDETYLDHAHHALEFLYDYGFDNGWYFVTDTKGNYKPHWGHNDWWSFQQHYALLGIAAMVEATGGNTNWGDGSLTDGHWLNTGINSNYTNLWDSDGDDFGYYEYASGNWKSKWNKGFTPTVDGITTHALLMAMMTDEPAHDARLFQLADNIVTHMTGNMSLAVMGFPEHFKSNWDVDYGYPSADIGHLYKTSWVLQRAYLMDTSRTKYSRAAQDIMWDLWEGGGYDKTNGGPFSVVDWQTGEVTNTDKNHWMVEQGLTAGLINYYSAETQADRDMYLEVADGSLSFYMDHMVDKVYGEVFSEVRADGGKLVDASKGGLFNGGYHSSEIGYYTYLYSSLYYHRAPVTLYYRYPADETSRTYKLTPVAIEDSVLKIVSVSKDGVPYTDFDGDARTLTLGPDVGGVFEVTFGFSSEPFHVISAVAGSGGAITPSGQVAVTEGRDISFVVSPGAGHSIDDVIVDGMSVGAVSEYTFSDVVADHTIEAVFDSVAFTIVSSAGAGGTISPSGSRAIEYGGYQTYTISPDAGLAVADVLVDGISVGPVEQFSFADVKADHSISASFSVAPTCDDRVLNGEETDVDCGGEVCTGCALGEQCLVDADCLSSACEDSICVDNVPGELTATIHVSNDWGGGYCADINISNGSSSAVSGWTVRLDMAGGTVFTRWNANYDGSSGEVTLTPFSWNAAIGAGQTVSSPGFCASRNGGGTAWVAEAVGQY